MEGVVSVCRGDGSLVHVPLAEFAGKLLKLVAANLWPDALQVIKSSSSEERRLLLNNPLPSITPYRMTVRHLHSPAARSK